jgi:protein-tyrosine-phosphatase
MNQFNLTNQIELMYIMIMTSMRSQPETSSLAFLQLAGHPIRWRILEELSRSDRMVQELVTAIGEQQNLVSYHLAKLRDASLVSVHRSAADRRDAYYTINLDKIGDGLSSAGGDLHPALRLDKPPRPRKVASHPRLLFLCTGNSARSPMAAALVNQALGNDMQADSAGSAPKSVHPNAVRAMKEMYGIDLSTHAPKHLDDFARQPFDCVITLCDRVREVCPEFPGHGDAIHWSIVNPVTAGPDSKTYPQFRQTAAELDKRIGYLLTALATQPRANRSHRRKP